MLGAGAGAGAAASATGAGISAGASAERLQRSGFFFDRKNFFGGLFFFESKGSA